MKCWSYGPLQFLRQMEKNDFYIIFSIWADWKKKQTNCFYIIFSMCTQNVTYLWWGLTFKRYLPLGQGPDFKIISLKCFSNAFYQNC